VTPGLEWNRLDGFMNKSLLDGEVALSVVIPAFNEAHRIPTSVPRLLETIPLAVELVVVDDGSTDDTADLLWSFLRKRPNTTVLTLPANAGKGAAVRAGMMQAQGEVIVFMDADLAADLGALPRLVASLDTAHVAIGSRKHSEAEIDKGLIRKIVSGVFTTATRMLAGLTFGDTQCGFKAFRRDTARWIFSHQQLDRFAFDVEVLVLAKRLGFTTVEVPIRWNDVDGSTVRWLLDPLQMLRDVARVRWMTRHVKSSGPHDLNNMMPSDAPNELAREVAACAS
jgi:glycosyltransferase involved in cell wall biosynthesis